jgi:hypothetical protein
MQNYRQAALCLHGLGPDDRQWLLSRLPDRHRAALHALLEELELLGIPGDQYPSEYARIAAPAGGEPGDAVLEIESASPEQIWSVLESEPDAIIRALLAARDWSWKSGIIARCRKGFRTITPPDRMLSGKVYAAMTKAIASRLRRLQPQAARRVSWHERLRKTLWQR